jgi:hypothetical protein
MIETAESLAVELLSGESVKGFYWQTRSYYHIPQNKKPDFIDSLSMGIYHHEGGTSGEFEIEWTRLQGKAVSRLKAFDDCWHVLPLLPELFTLMAQVSSSSDTPAYSTEDFTKRLVEMGWRDLTRYRDGQGDGFERRSLHGEIPPHVQPLFPGYTHFTSARRVDDTWGDQLSGPYEVRNDALYLLTNADDALLTHLRLG